MCMCVFHEQQATKLSVMGLLAHLELTLGRCVAASAIESMAIAVK